MQISSSVVYIGGTPAYLTYAQDGQINALVPFKVSGLSNASIQVQYNGVMGNIVTIPIVASAPGIFTSPMDPARRGSQIRMGLSIPLRIPLPAALTSPSG